MSWKKPPHAPSWYKNAEQYYRAVFRANKEIITATLGDADFTTPYKAFKERLTELKQSQYIREKYGLKGVKPKEIVSDYFKTEKFISTSERMRTNAINTLREDKDMFKEFRRMTGWKNKIDIANMKWDPDAQAYIYHGANGTVMIDFTNSPKGIRLYVAK